MKKNAFTLIELLLVVIIVALLLIAAIAMTFQHVKSSRDSKRKEDILLIQKYLEDYFGKNHSYPAGNYSSLVASLSTMTAHIQSIKDPSGLTYTYSGSSTGQDYCLCAKMETNSGNSAANCDFNSGKDFFCKKNSL